MVSAIAFMTDFIYHLNIQCLLLHEMSDSNVKRNRRVSYNLRITNPLSSLVLCDHDLLINNLLLHVS